MPSHCYNLGYMIKALIPVNVCPSSGNPQHVLLKPMRDVFIHSAQRCSINPTLTSPPNFAAPITTSLI